MSPLRWHHRPELRRPVLIAAFEGWNDAGDAASGAARWLADRYGAELVATIEAEEFFDFTTTRPIVEVGDDGRRKLTWPDTELWAATTDSGTDLVILVGHEPHLRWRTYCTAVLDAARELDCSLLVTLGALLSEVPHTRPTAVSGTADEPGLIERLDLARSTYEGPTGIVGVLHASCNLVEQPSASLWAAVPTYVSGAPSPKATLALVERTIALVGLGVPTTDLQIASAAYERQIDQLVADDEDTAAYVASLEEAADDPDEDDDDLEAFAATDPSELVEEVERFLRGD
ncbi:PAC2 family protein [Aquihabitans sp. G128]|uniref:PAC2 family protein n=1 Tax=Aquihabitans sp. G128 TaxID=2849779 RepID=UPI001C24815D|nr:PAC2 family protein [Aquihabitans sp. G128]QXC59120.1 PAC2 family protein [Aquihabitans sp. G128]